MPESITCPRCGRTSYNIKDIQEGYCGHCQWWTSHPVLGQPDVIMVVGGGGTKAEIVTVTPAMARDWLARPGRYDRDHG